MGVVLTLPMTPPAQSDTFDAFISSMATYEASSSNAAIAQQQGLAFQQTLQNVGQYFAGPVPAPGFTPMMYQRTGIGSPCY